MVEFTDILKDSSQRVVLNLIRLHKELSGAELSRLTGLQPSTIVYILRALKNKKLIEKKGVGASTNRGGKKPTLWRIRAKSRWCLGLEILPTQIRVIATSINDQVGFKESVIIQKGINKKNIIHHVIKIVEPFLKQQSNNLILTGIGIAIPGIIETETGNILYSSSLDLKNFDLVTPLEAALGIPVIIGNDANAGALALQWYPDSTKHLYNNKVFIMYNQEAKNLGSGLIINNSLFIGSSGTAGEIFSPLPNILDLMKEGIRQSDEKSILKQEDTEDTQDLTCLSELAEKGCPASYYVLTAVCNYIAREMINITGLINPDLIVLGGDLPKPDYWIKKAILPVVRKEMDSKLKRGYLIPEIRASELKEYAVAMGANALILSTWLDPKR